MGQPPDYPSYAPPKWLVGRAVWRFWTASPARLLAQRIGDVVILLVALVVLLVLHAPLAYWILWALATVFEVAVIARYGPGILRAYRELHER
jgi:hypothetical protein